MEHVGADAQVGFLTNGRPELSNRSAAHETTSGIGVREKSFENNQVDSTQDSILLGVDQSVFPQCSPLVGARSNRFTIAVGLWLEGSNPSSAASARGHWMGKPLMVVPLSSQNG